MTTHIARKVVQSAKSWKASPHRPKNLSTREQEVLDCLSQGFLYKEIAEKLGISYETVHTYIRRIYEKLQVRTRTEAVAKFFCASIIFQHLSNCHYEPAKILLYSILFSLHHLKTGPPGT